MTSSLFITAFSFSVCYLLKYVIIDNRGFVTPKSHLAMHHISSLAYRDPSRNSHAPDRSITDRPFFPTLLLLFFSLVDLYFLGRVFFVM